jgi:transposase
VHIIEDLAGDWRRLDERVESLSKEIVAIARQDASCERLISVPSIGPIISSAMVAAIGAGDVFTKGRDFGAWLALELDARVRLRPVALHRSIQFESF